MDPFTLSLIGAGLGGLFSKNHLKGALMGGMGGYAGGAAMPGLLGGSTAAEAGGALQLATPAELTASGYSAPLSGTGLLGQGADMLAQAGDKLKAVNTAFKPVGQAMSSANAVSGLLASPPPIEAPAPHLGGGGNAQFQALEQQQLALDQQRMQDEMQRRQAQQKLLAMIGGSYGRTA